MTSEQTNGILREVRRAALLCDHGEVTDGQLLQRFLDQRDETAFELLLRRHGPMILGVCRRMLHNEADADDAFQAVFVVLVRKAAAFRTRRTIGDWLYGVAYHTALKARAASVKRRFKESQVRPINSEDAADDLAEFLPLLDQEITRLPVKYREPLVLCELQGRSRMETARQLGIPEGTLSSRLARARAMLAKRLARQGLAITVGTLAALLTAKMATASVPQALAASTLEAATAGAMAPVAALAEGVLKAMLLTKLKVLGAVMLMFGFVVVGVFVWRSAAISQARAQEEAARAHQVEAEAIFRADEVENIQGTWTLVRIEQAKPEPAKKEQETPERQPKVVITADRIRLWDGSEGSYSLDFAKHPRQLRMTLGGGALPATIIGIYELNDDELKICLNLSHSDNRLPTSFDIKSARPPALVPAVFVLKRDPVKDGTKKEEAKKTDTDQAPRTQVRFIGAAGAKIRRADVNQAAKEMPCRLTFETPGLYRLKITNIPNRPGLELYPTVEVYPATQKTTTFLMHSAVPVEFTDAEIDKAVKGKLATCAVCLHPDGEQTFAITEAPVNDDVVGLAKMKGPILLVSRLGSIDLEAKKESEEKDYRAALIAALHHFAYEGNLDHVKALVNRHPDLVDARPPVPRADQLTGGDYTALILAVANNHDQVAAFLLTKGANVQEVSQGGGWKRDHFDPFGSSALNSMEGGQSYRWTPLHFAAQQGNIAMAKLLVKHGAKVGAKDQSGRTPLDVAKTTQMTEYLKSLQK